MTRTRLMLLGLCAALFGLMAFSASGAQAAKWLILMFNGEVLTGEQLKAEVGGQVETTPILHTEILKIKFLVTCTGFTTIGIFLEGAGKMTEGGKVKFTGCTAETNGELNANCNLSSGGEPVGTILTNGVKGQLVLSEGVGLTKIEPSTAGGPFATLKMSALCPVGTSLPINGVIYLKDCEGKLETHLVKHLLEVAKPPTEVWVTNNNNAEHKVTLLGSGWYFLTGAHAGLAWGGMPE